MQRGHPLPPPRFLMSGLGRLVLSHRFVLLPVAAPGSFLLATEMAVRLLSLYGLNFHALFS